ncbi:Dipeptidase [Microbulbifer donghaiensis]|uniref:Dipeptidase n=1 Tax=Microbulbifer donghaiensis TaxID=494016 RepID=A0A1M5G130_9GAMM|nr:C69 family dipeptidase [Microbulbifer donghaiensis]SHF97500.1 Dipeptidase [Microbulbifer donghaiensis]
MCDTQIIKKSGETWFAKNSDREPGEAQIVCFIPPVSADRSKEVRTTYISIPQVPERFGMILSKPAWIWGAEIGVNERGVAIGNEAVFTRLVARKGSALLGMDLLRLGLERGATARQALNVITALLEAHGQGGAAGYRDKSFRYDNSFIIADSNEGWVLETAGRHWVAKRVDGCAAISNALSIGAEFDLSSESLSGHIETAGDLAFNFARRFDTRFMKLMGRASERRRASLDSLAAIEEPSVAALAASLRRHHCDGEEFSRFSNRDLCMHAAGITRPSQTCGSMIVRLATGAVPRVWVTGTSAPCLSLFQPVDFSTASGLVFPVDGEVRQSPWFRFERVHRRALHDRDFRTQLREDRDRVERQLMDAMEAGRGVAAVSEIAESWHQRWSARAAQCAPDYRWYSAYDRYWKKLSRLDAL